MATDVQATPALAIEGPSRAELSTKLDGLLEGYLHTLDAYQRAHRQLTEHLSSGYFALAQANFNNPRSRYGQDYFDDRMRASRTVALSEGGFQVTLNAPAPGELHVADAGTKGPHTAEGRAAEGTATVDEKGDGTDASPASSAASINLSADPIRWFGILVPGALRSAQASFVCAVEGPIPRLSTLAADLRKQEVEIARLRKQIRRL